jgi:hypothetical protein
MGVQLIWKLNRFLSIGKNHDAGPILYAHPDSERKSMSGPPVERYYSMDKLLGIGQGRDFAGGCCSRDKWLCNKSTLLIF